MSIVWISPLGQSSLGWECISQKRKIEKVNAKYHAVHAVLWVEASYSPRVLVFAGTASSSTYYTIVFVYNINYENEIDLYIVYSEIDWM